MTPLYTAVATATGDGRDGKVRSSDGLLETAVATPAELGGAGGACRCGGRQSSSSQGHAPHEIPAR